MVEEGRSTEEEEDEEEEEEEEREDGKVENRATISEGSIFLWIFLLLGVLLLCFFVCYFLNITYYTVDVDVVVVFA